MKATIEMIRSVARSAGHEPKRNFSGYVADRIVRAVSQPTLVDAVERLAQSMDASVEYVGGKRLAAFMSEATGPKAQAILAWMRTHPKFVAMLATMKDDGDLTDAIDAIELPEIDSSDQSTVGDTPAYDVALTVECLSGLAHGGDQKAGNATLFRRRSVITASGRHLHLPVYAGNALRGQLRDLLADHFLRALGLTPSRSKPVVELWAFHVLYSGGVLEGAASKAEANLGKSGAIRTEGMRELRDHIPLLSTLGTAIGNRVIAGRIYVGDLRPECVEWSGGSQRAGDLMAWEFLTRKDDFEGRQEDDSTSQMIAETEILKPGTVLRGGIDIDDHANEIERACLARGLALLKERGRLGAETRRGLGKIAVEMAPEQDPGPYDAFLSDRKRDILDFLTRLGALAGKD